MQGCYEDYPIGYKYKLRLSIKTPLYGNIEGFSAFYMVFEGFDTFDAISKAYLRFLPI